MWQGPDLSCRVLLRARNARGVTFVGTLDASCDRTERHLEGEYKINDVQFSKITRCIACHTVQWSKHFTDCLRGDLVPLQAKWNLDRCHHRQYKGLWRPSGLWVWCRWQKIRKEVLHLADQRQRAKVNLCSGAATLAGFDLKLRFCLSFLSSATRLVGSRLAGTFQCSVVHSVPRSPSHDDMPCQGEGGWAGGRPRHPKPGLRASLGFAHSPMMDSDGYDIAREACPPHHIKVFHWYCNTDVSCYSCVGRQQDLEFRGSFERMRRKGLSEKAGVDSNQNELFFDVSECFRCCHFQRYAFNGLGFVYDKCSANGEHESFQ